MRANSAIIMLLALCSAIAPTAQAEVRITDQTPSHCWFSGQPLESRFEISGLDGRRAIAQLGLLYLLFGATYMIFATFIVTTLVQDRGFSEAAAGQVWAWVGVFSLLSGPLFGIFA